MAQEPLTFASAPAGPNRGDRGTNGLYDRAPVGVGASRRSPQRTQQCVWGGEVQVEHRWVKLVYPRILQACEHPMARNDVGGSAKGPLVEQRNRVHRGKAAADEDGVAIVEA